MDVSGSDGYFGRMARDQEGIYRYVCHILASRAISHIQKEESILVLRGLGVQTMTSSSTYLTTPTTRFIPTTEIQDIFIHEAFRGFEVRFYLTVVVEGEEDTVVVFPVSLPEVYVADHR